MATEVVEADSAVETVAITIMANISRANIPRKDSAEEAATTSSNPRSLTTMLLLHKGQLVATVANSSSNR